MKIAFYKGRRPGWHGWLSRLITLADAGKYSHCELVFSDGLCASASLIDGGVRLKKIDFEPGHWDFLDLGSPEHQARAWFEQHQGAGYDLPGSIGIAVRIMPQAEARWFCSEAVAAALGFAEPWRIGPNTLYALMRPPPAPK